MKLKFDHNNALGVLISAAMLAGSFGLSWLGGFVIWWQVLGSLAFGVLGLLVLMSVIVSAGKKPA